MSLFDWGGKKRKERERIEREEAHQRREEMRRRQKRELSNQVERLSLAAPQVIDDEEEAAAIQLSLRQVADESAHKEYELNILKNVIREGCDISDFDRSYQAARNAVPVALGSGISVPIARDLLPWSIVMTSNFTKSLGKVDGKLRGKLLGAIAEISDKPTTLRGNTVKPLSHDLKDCWRYRIGDHRLVYLPDPKEKNVVLLRFSPRGAVYD